MTVKVPHGRGRANKTPWEKDRTLKGLFLYFLFSFFLSVFCLFLFVCLVFLHIKMYEYCILCSPGCPRTCAVDNAYLGLRESVLPRLRLCSNIPSLEKILYGVDDRPQLNCLQIID